MRMPTLYRAFLEPGIHGGPLYEVSLQETVLQACQTPSPDDAIALLEHFLFLRKHLAIEEALKVVKSVIDALTNLQAALDDSVETAWVTVPPKQDGVAHLMANGEPWPPRPQIEISRRGSSIISVFRALETAETTL